MSKIKILPEILSNKIAAGEVVERPASVVKELVENALDAVSTQIRVDVESGGRSLIRVADNGAGMSRDDALLSLERYATSKIYNDDDLFAIATLGFRGEALPSIASVSRFELITRQAAADEGTCITVEGGKILSVAATGAPPGTMITIRQLFFNTPARRKFLKTVNTEMGHVGDTVSRIALGNPGVRFTLTHNGSGVKDWPATGDGGMRVADVLGPETASDLIPIDIDATGVAVTGWCLPGRHNRTTSRGIYTFVNGRFVRDRVVQHAVMAGYTGRLMRGQYPVAVVFIRVPPDRVDVNVHPTKHEIRFADQRLVHDHIVRAVMTTLRKSDPGGGGVSSPTPSAPAPLVAAQLREHVRPYSSAAPKNIWRPSADDLRKQPVGSLFAPAAHSLLKADSGNAEDPAKNRSTSAPFRFEDLRVIGQYQGTYILCERPAGLVVIDQHAAHERVVYEELIRQSAREKPESQRLLMPETIELGFREADAIEQLLPTLRRLGFVLEPFGQATWALTAVPALLARVAAVPILRDLVEKTIDAGGEPSPNRLLEPIIARIACHEAIRANHDLDITEMQALLTQLAACSNPSHCPHGRPLWIQWTPRDLEKLFRRVV